MVAANNGFWREFTIEEEEVWGFAGLRVCRFAGLRVCGFLRRDDYIYDYIKDFASNLGIGLL